VVTHVVPENQFRHLPNSIATSRSHRCSCSLRSNKGATLPSQPCIRWPTDFGKS